MVISCGIEEKNGSNFDVLESTVWMLYDYDTLFTEIFDE